MINHGLWFLLPIYEHWVRLFLMFVCGNLEAVARRAFNDAFLQFPAQISIVTHLVIIIRSLRILTFRHCNEFNGTSLKLFFFTCWLCSVLLLWLNWSIFSNVHKLDYAKKLYIFNGKEKCKHTWNCYIRHTIFIIKCSAIVLLNNWLLKIFFIALSTNAEIYIACKICEFPD